MKMKSNPVGKTITEMTEREIHKLLGTEDKLDEIIDEVDAIHRELLLSSTNPEVVEEAGGMARRSETFSAASEHLTHNIS